MDAKIINDLLCEIDDLESEMRGLHFKRNVVDAYYLSLWCLVIAAWLHSGGMKRLRTPPQPSPTPQHFHATDILVLAYLSSVLVQSPIQTSPRVALETSDFTSVQARDTLPTH